MYKVKFWHSSDRDDTTRLFCKWSEWWVLCCS